MTALRPLPSTFGRAEKIRPSTRSTTSRITYTITSVPNTCQPWPRTSARLRPKDASAPTPSITMTGTITAQIVIRYKPGAMIRASPITIAMPARTEATMTRPRYGTTADTVSPIDMSTRPSRTSCTALTSVACSKKAATMLTREPSRSPKVPASDKIAAMIAATT